MTTDELLQRMQTAREQLLKASDALVRGAQALGEPHRDTATYGDYGGELREEHEEPQRYPCSPTCTHDDAANPGHPERVKALGEEAMWRIVAPDAPPGSPVVEEAAVNAALAADEDARESEEYQMGAEAMRAACWEAVRHRLWHHGLYQYTEDVKAAIEGVTP